jgi:hypothetical protein
LIVDAYDEVYVYGRMGSLRYKSYVDDISPDLMTKIRNKVHNHESVVLPGDIYVMHDEPVKYEIFPGEFI